jgi:membrane-bound inhibitor of C-type lysozyme
MTLRFKALILPVVLASLALVGCNSPAPNAPASDDLAAENSTVVDDATAAAEALEGDTVVFQCPDGETVTAQFNGTDTAIVTLPDQEPVTLAIAESASGARYSDGTTTLWNKGDEALVEVNGEVILSECKAQN